MITQETAKDIWGCYREIAAGEKLLEDMQEMKKQHPHNKCAQQLKDAFGQGQNLELGIPSGRDGYRLIGVSPDLAEAVIRAHIATKRAELATINEKARIESGLKRGRDKRGEV